MRKIEGIKIPDKDTYQIESTYEYGRFRFIEGNRSVDHAEKIEKSIRSSGLLIQPILVDENMRIIEGQNRYTACVNLGLPIYYVVQEGIGLNEVKDLNSASKNWNTRNYIHSYAAGDKKLDYIYIEQLMKQFPWATNRAINFAVNGFAGSMKSNVRNGNLRCSEVEYNRAVNALDYANQFRGFIDEMSGSKEFYIVAVLFCFFCEAVDNDYLLTKFKKYHKSLSPIVDINSAILQIENKVYNYQMRSPREPISLTNEYERMKRANRRAAYRKDRS